MKRVLLVIALVGCAQQPRQPTDAQLAVLSYYAHKCEQQGVNMNDGQVLRGCILSLYQRDVASGLYGRGPSFGDALQGLGSVYSSGALRQQQCSTRPDYAGGWITTCN